MCIPFQRHIASIFNLYRSIITMADSNGNAMSAASDPYRLNRDVAASTRLSLQHYIWKENMGYLLHPAIDVSRPDLTIADVGTGTGYGSVNGRLDCSNQR